MKNFNYSCKIKDSIDKLINVIRDRKHWKNIEKSKTLTRYTFLDPRLKNLAFIHNESMLTSIKNNVVEHTANINSLARSDIPLEEETSTSFEPQSSTSEEKPLFI